MFARYKAVFLNVGLKHVGLKGFEAGLKSIQKIGLITKFYVGTKNAHTALKFSKSQINQKLF